MAEIHHIVQKLVNHEMSSGSYFVNRKTIHLRVLMRVANILGITMHEIYETKEQIKIHSTVSERIERLWSMGRLLPKSISHSAKDDFQSTVERFLSKDFLNTADLHKFCSVMQKVNPEAHKDVWCLFAVDGLSGNHLEKYTENLSFDVKLGSLPFSSSESEELDMKDAKQESPQETHVRAVRSIYQFLAGVTPEGLGRTLKRIFDSDSDDSSSEAEYNETIDEDDDKVLENCIVNEYQRYTGKNLKNVILWMGERQKLMQHRKRKSEKRAAAALANKKRHSKETL